MTTSVVYETRPSDPVGARLTSTMPAFAGFFGSSLPWTIPEITSYVPALPKAAPP